MHFPIQEGSGCQNYLLSSNFGSVAKNNSIDYITLHSEVSDFTNYNFKVWCIP